MAKYKHYILFSITVLVFLSVLYLQNSKINQLTADNEAYKETILELEERLVDLKNEQREELDKLTEELTQIDYFSVRELEMRGITDLEIIKESLKSSPQLIPYEGILGGTMFFYEVKILNYKWAFASFEDGHIAGQALYSYTVEENGDISWELINSFVFGESDRETSAQLQPDGEIYRLVYNHFQDDSTIAEFTIDHLEFSHLNSQEKVVYQLTYSMKPSDRDSFVLAGSGIEGEDGWINQRYYYITVDGANRVSFSTSP